MSDVNSWLKEATPHRKTVKVCFDRNLIAEWDKASEELQEAKKGMLEPPKEMKKRVDELAVKVAKATREFVFQSIGNGPWRRLVAEHPPTKEQRRDLSLDHDPETFLPAVMVATCVSPQLTLEQAEQILETQPLAVIDRLWAGILEANLIGGDEKKVGATVALRALEQK